MRISDWSSDVCSSDLGAPARSGARPGDQIWVTGTIGNAGVGLAMRLGEIEPNETCLAAYRRPQPQLTFGQAVVPHAHAMMDVSDGLLIDAQRMAEASGCRFGLMLEPVPLSAAPLAVRPSERTRLEWGKGGYGR